MPQPFKLNAQLILHPPQNIDAIVGGIRGKIERGLSIPLADNVQTRAAVQNIKKLETGAKGLAKASRGARYEFEDVAIEIGNVTNKGVKGMAKTERSIRRASGAISEFGDKAALALKRYSAFVVATTAFYTTGRLVGGGLKQGIEFERQMIKIAQVTGSSMNELKGLSQEIGRLSSSLGVSRSELVEVARVLAQTGMTATDTRKALEAIALTDLAPTFKNMSSTVEGTVAIMSQFGISADQLATSLGQINAVASKFPVESEGIISAVKRMGGIFSLMSKGVAEGNDALAQMIGLFTSVYGITRESPERVSTGLRTIIGRLQRRENRQTLAQYGINLEENGEFVGVFEAFQRIGRGLKQMGPRSLQRMAVIEQLGGLRQLGRLIPAIENTEMALNAYNSALAGQNSLIKDSIIAQQSMQVQMQKVGQEFAELMYDLSQTESFKMMISLMLTGARAALTLAESLKEVIPLLAVIGLAKGVGMVGKALPAFGRRIVSGGHTTGFGRQAGGVIPGSGSGDKIPIMAEPGEMVINRKAVKAVGASNLAALNRAIPRFASGGMVAGYATGFSRDVGGGMWQFGDKFTKPLWDLAKASDKLETNFGKMNKGLEKSPLILPSGFVSKQAGMRRMEAAEHEANVRTVQWMKDSRQAMRADVGRARTKWPGLSVLPMGSTLEGKLATFQQRKADSIRAMNEYYSRMRRPSSAQDIAEMNDRLIANYMAPSGLAPMPGYLKRWKKGTSIDFSNQALGLGGTDPTTLAKRYAASRNYAVDLRNYTDSTFRGFGRGRMGRMFDRIRGAGGLFRRGGGALLGRGFGGGGFAGLGRALANPQTMLLGSLAASSMLPDDQYGISAGVQSAMAGGVVGSMFGFGKLGLGGAIALGGIKGMGDAYYRKQQEALARRGIGAAQQGRIYNAQSTLDNYRLVAAGLVGGNRRDFIASTELGTFGTLFSSKAERADAFEKAITRMGGEAAGAGSERAKAAQVEIQSRIRSGKKISRSLIRDVLAGDIEYQKEKRRVGSGNLILGKYEEKYRTRWAQQREGIRRQNVMEAREMGTLGGISRFSALLSRAGAESKEFGFARQAAAAGFGGSFGATRQYRENVFNNLQGYGIGQIAGALGGPIMGKLPSDIKGAVYTNRALGGLAPLIRAKATTHRGQTISSLIGSELTREGGALAGLPPNIGKTILAQVSASSLGAKTIGEFVDSGKNIKDMMENLSPASKAAVAALSKLQDQINALKDRTLASFSQLGGMAAEVGMTQVQAGQVGVRGRLIRKSLLGQRIGVRESIAAQLSQVRHLAGTTDPRQITQNIMDLQKQLDAESKKESPDGRRIMELTRELKLNSEASKMLRQGIIGLTEIQNRMTELNKRRLGGEDFLMEMFTAGPSELARRASKISAFQLFQRGGPKAVVGGRFTQQDVVEGFQEANRLTRAIDPRQYEKNRREFLTKFASSLGLDLTAFTKQTGALTERGTTEEEKRLMQDFNEAQKRQQEALLSHAEVLEFFAGRFETAVREDLNIQMEKFHRAVENLHIPETITVNGNIQLNGQIAISDAFASLVPSLKQMVAGQVQMMINDHINSVDGSSHPSAPVRVGPPIVPLP